MKFLGRYSLGLLGLVIAASLVACDNIPREADLTWIEPVMLQSGDTVYIKRHVVFVHERALGGGFGSAPRFSTSSIELMPADAGFPMWDAPLLPIVLDRDPKGGDWIVVASIDGCAMWARNGRPRPPYWAFRLRHGHWFRDTIPTELWDRPANLFADVRVTDTSNELTETVVKRKQQQFTSTTLARIYKRVDSKYVKGCDSAASDAVGTNELDLNQFGRTR